MCSMEEGGGVPGQNHPASEDGSSQQQDGEKPVVVYVALLANLAIAITKLLASMLSGSSAMLAEGVHSLVDTGNEVLLLLGLHRSQKKADEAHPFGYGMELYFWSLIVSVILFSVGGGMSIAEGVGRLLTPQPLEDATLSYAVLAVAAVFDGTSFAFAVRKMLATPKPHGDLWHKVHYSKDPSKFTVVYEDAADLCGIIIAALGVFVSHLLRNPAVDAAASVLIGCVLAVVASGLVAEMKGLITGEGVSPEMSRTILQLAEGDEAVQTAQQPLTMYLGPHQVLMNLNVKFRDGLSTAELNRAVDRIEGAVRQRYPEVQHIFIEANALAAARQPWGAVEE